MSAAPRRDPKQTAAPAGWPDPAAPCLLGLFTGDPVAAEAAIVKLRDAGVDPTQVSIIARGRQFEKRLIRSGEQNANALVSADEEPDLPVLVHRLASEPKLLLEGCWAIGPLFHQQSAKTQGAQGVESLARALLNAGLDIKEAADLESTLKTVGGLWLGVQGVAGELEKVAREIETLPGISAGLIRLAC